MFTSRDHTIWAEKYRPDTLDNYIGNEHIKAKVAHYIKEADIPHLLFFGTAGTGKTSLSKILVNSINCDHMIINASDENNVDTVRNKIRGFASTLGFNPLKIMVLDEFDGFTPQAQSALRNLMEQFSLTTRFILTANYIERIIEPLQSRVQTFQIVPPTKKDVALHVVNILKAEGITHSLPDVKVILDAYFPDIRKVLNELQLNVRDNTLTIDKSSVIENDYKLKVVELLKGSMNKKEKFTTIRQHLLNANIRDYNIIYRTLYDNITEYAKDNISAAILAINEGQFRDATVIDKEINCMATILNLINL